MNPEEQPGDSRSACRGTMKLWAPAKLSSAVNAKSSCIRFSTGERTQCQSGSDLACNASPARTFGDSPKRTFSAKYHRHRLTPSSAELWLGRRIFTDSAATDYLFHLCNSAKSADHRLAPRILVPRAGMSRS
jgi:hypothetical protein